MLVSLDEPRAPRGSASLPWCDVEQHSDRLILDNPGVRPPAHSLRTLLTLVLFAATLVATLLVLAAAARRGVDLPPPEVMTVASWLVPAMLVVGLLGLWAL